MEQITIRPSNEPLQIKITVDFLGAWKYIYVISDVPPIDHQYSSNQQPKDFPHVYTIGTGNAILDECHNWDIQLLNQSDSNQDYNVKIEWYQGTDAVPLYIWSKKSSVDGKISGGAIKNLKGDCQFI